MFVDETREFLIHKVLLNHMLRTDSSQNVYNEFIFQRVLAEMANESSVTEYVCTEIKSSFPLS